MAGNAREEILYCFVEFEARVERLNCTGYESRDFLNSPLVRLLCLKNNLLKRVFIQVGEKLPVNLRPLIGVKKYWSAKAAGFFARAYLHAYQATGERTWLDKAVRLLDRLPAEAAEGYSGLAWGNTFEYASRAGLFPRGLPTVVWTSHISKAFDLAYSITNNARYGEAVRSAGRFVLRDLEKLQSLDGLCIAYAPGIAEPIHNSNLLGAVALLRAWRLDRDAEKLDVAAKAFRWSIARMNDDGSWYYGEGDRYRWMDNFHTGYVLDCLLEGHRTCGDDLVPRSILQKSYDFWKRSFFLGDGTPKYFPDRVYPIDIQCAAQAIETFANFSQADGEALDRGLSVLRWTVRNMRRRDGLFVYQRRRLYTNRLVCIHWGQATMLAAMGALMFHSAKSSAPHDRTGPGGPTASAPGRSR